MSRGVHAFWFPPLFLDARLLWALSLFNFGVNPIFFPKKIFFKRYVSADSLSSAPLLSAYFPFFHCRGLDFVTGFEEPDSALLPSSGSRWSSSISKLNMGFRPDIGGSHPAT